jgi:phage terminase small subunit
MGRTVRLTPQQQAFLDAYLICGNASAAAREVGYSSRNAHKIGWRLTRKPHIRARINVIDKAREEVWQNTRAAYVAETERLAAEVYRDVGKYVVGKP